MGGMQVAEGIHKVEGVRVANVWLVEVEDGLLDMDHVGGAAELKRRTGAQVAIHELDAPAIVSPSCRRRSGATGRTRSR